MHASWEYPSGAVQSGGTAPEKRWRDDADDERFDRCRKYADRCSFSSLHLQLATFSRSVCSDFRNSLPCLYTDIHEFTPTRTLLPTESDTRVRDEISWRWNFYRASIKCLDSYDRCYNLPICTLVPNYTSKSFKNRINQEHKCTNDNEKSSII